MSEASRTPGKLEIESAIMDAMGDARVLDIVLMKANESGRNEAGEQSTMMVDEETFLAWMRACNHFVGSVQEVERVFYAAKL